MALVRQCDRCGKIYDQRIENNKRNGVVTAQIRAYGDTAFDYYGPDVKSLCPECMASFYKWFKEV